MTGCDFNPAFHRKRKQRLLKLLQDYKKLQRAFAESGSGNCIESFFSTLYTLQSLDVANNARFMLFLRTYEVNDINEPLKKKVQNFYASSIPPCAAELRQPSFRQMYIAKLWRHAYKKISTLIPENCG